MEIRENYNLKDLNTFGVSAFARYFTEVSSEAELRSLFDNPIFKTQEKLILGGGSNILFTQNFDGFVILNKIKGIQILEEDDNNVTIKSMGGEIWHDLVVFTTDRGYWGIENLSLIPGTVGAAPMQNIGAYGGELRNTFVGLEGIHLGTGEKKFFSKEECNLGYRESVFKNEIKGEYFILSVTFKLSKKEDKNLDYKILKEYLDKNKIEVSSSKDISEAVANIRRSKLPDWKVLGNAGSFFKNVFVSKSELEALREKYPDMPSFEEGKKFKIPTAWLIENCGWKGKRVGNVGVHDKQALILVNHGGADGEEIKSLATDIMQSVFEKFGLKLSMEVNLV